MALDDSFGRRDRRSGGGRDRSPMRGGRASKSECRVFVSNLPYEFRWQELKDLLRREVGEVAFVELFNDENEKSKGCGIVEFESPDSVKKAIDKLHRFDVDGRKIIVKEDYGAPRDKFGNILRNRDRDRGHDDSRNNRDGGNKSYVWGDTYGLSPSFLEGLGISPPLVTRVFVANLDYKVTEKKLKEVFKMAGKVREVDLSTDSDGKSRGFAVIEFDHPVECVQAISMFNNQQLYDRRLSVRMDRVESDRGDRLPEGLHSVGMGLGQNGAPLKDVARNLPNLSSNNLSALQTQSSLNNLTAAAALTAATPLSAISGLPSAAALQAAAALAPSTSNLLGSTANLDILAGRALSASHLAARDLQLGSLSGLGSSLMDSNGPSLSSSLGNQNSVRDSFNDRNVSLRSSNSSTKTSDTIIVDNLPHNFTWQNLKDKFRDVGDIKFAEMRGKLGLIRFNSEWEALRAVSLMDRTRVEGHPIDVRLF